jgi:hypothetical protein
MNLLPVDFGVLPIDGAMGGGWERMGNVSRDVGILWAWLGIVMRFQSN